MIGRKSRVLAVVGAAALLTVVAGCTSGGISGSGGSPDGNLTVGIITINTGSYAALSEESYDAAVVTAKRLNAKDHARNIEIKQIDTDGTPSNTLQAVQRSVQVDGVHYVSGFLTSSTAAVLSSQADRLRILVLTSVAQSSDLVGSTCGPNYFQFAAIDSQYILAAEKVIKQSGIKDWDTVAEDYSAGRDKAETFAKALEDVGGKVHRSVFPQLGATDFGTQISQLGSDPAEGLFVGILGADAATFAKQATQFGLFKKYKFVLGSGFLQQTLLPALGPGVIGAHEVLNYSPTEVEKTQFAHDYRDAGQKDGLWHVPIEANLALTVLDASADKARSAAVEDVGPAMSGISVDTIVGRVKIRAADHLLEQPLYPAHVEAGPKLVSDFRVPASEATPPVSPECSMASG